MLRLKNYALSLKKDLENDIEMSERILSQARRIYLNIDSLSKYVSLTSIVEIENANVACQE